MAALWFLVLPVLGNEAFTYSCAQSEEHEHKSKAPKLAKATRNLRHIDRFPCNGWLNLTVSATSNEVVLSLKHSVTHLAYVDLALPEKWKAYIREHATRLTRGKA